MALGDRHEAALGDVHDLGLDAACAELAHLRVELDRQARMPPPLVLVLGNAGLHQDTHLHPRLLRRERERQADAPILDPSHLCRDRAPVKQLKR